MKENIKIYFFVALVTASLITATLGKNASIKRTANK
jgi:hypothetical protein